MPTFAAQINAMKIPIKGLVAESSAVAPDSPVSGQLWYDETASKLKVRQGAAWVALDADTTYSLVSQIEAEAGTATTARTWSAQRVKQAIDSLSPVKSVAGKTGAVTLAKGDVGLGNVDNTSDASKPVSTATQTALNGKANTTHTHTIAQVTSLQTELDAKVPTARTITAGNGLTGGGNLTTNRSLAADFGIGAGKVLEGNTRLDELASPNGPIDFFGVNLENVGHPWAGTDAANKAYVDNVAQGLAAKQSVKAATTGNIALSGTQTVDGVPIVANDRVLVKNQTSASANGIYVVSTGAWTRATDADGTEELRSAFVFVEEGTTNADTGWLQTSDNITVGVTPLNWVQFSGAGQITAGTGLTKTGNTLAVDFAVSGGGTASQAVRGTDSRLSNARTPTAHTHKASDIDTGTLDIARIPTGISPSTVALGNHGHALTSTNITGVLPIEKAPTPASGAATANQLVRGNDPRLTDARTPTAHTHNANDINAGTLPIERGGTGQGTVGTAKNALSTGSGTFVLAVPALPAGSWVTVLPSADMLSMGISLLTEAVLVAGTDRYILDVRDDSSGTQVKSDIAFAAGAGVLALVGV